MNLLQVLLVETAPVQKPALAVKSFDIHRHCNASTLKIPGNGPERHSDCREIIAPDRLDQRAAVTLDRVGTGFIEGFVLLKVLLDFLPAIGPHFY